MREPYRVVQTFECDEEGALIKGGMATQDGKRIGPYTEGQLLALELGRKRTWARDYNATREMYDVKLSNERRFRAAYLAFSTGNDCSFMCRRTTRVVREGDKYYREVVKTAIPLSELAEEMNKNPKTGNPRQTGAKLKGFIGAIGNLARREKKLRYLRNEGHTWFIVPGDEKAGPDQDPEEDSGFKADEEEWRGLNPERAALLDTWKKGVKEIQQEIRTYHRDKQRAAKANGTPVPVPPPATAPLGAGGGKPDGASGEALGASGKVPLTPPGNGDPYPYKGLLSTTTLNVVVSTEQKDDDDERPRTPDPPAIPHGEDPDPVGRALGEYVATDDALVREVIRGCRERTPDITIPEIVQVVHLKGPGTLAAKPHKPGGHLMRSIWNFCEGESFRRFRERIRGSPSVFDPPDALTREEQIESLRICMEWVESVPDSVNTPSFREEIAAAQERDPELYAEACRRREAAAGGQGKAAAS